MYKIWFTPEEANRRLPLIKRIVADILSRGQELKHVTAQESSGASHRLDHLENEVTAYVKEIEDLGCFYKDWNFELGLVDFPAMIDGEPVMLCWRSDEEQVSWYHSLQEGYAGRTPIPQELLQAN